jgi:hypothetical protein
VVLLLLAIVAEFVRKSGAAAALALVAGRQQRSFLGPV